MQNPENEKSAGADEIIGEAINGGSVESLADISSPCQSGDGCSGDGGCSRGQFLKVVIPCIGGVWALMAAYPIYSYLTPNGGDEPDSKVTSVTVGDIKDLPPGSGKNFKFGSIPALVIHTKDGQLHAFTATCTHLGCTAQFRPEKDLIWCACHGGCYDPTTGKNVAGPPPKPLTALKVELVNDKIIVSKG